MITKRTVFIIGAVASMPYGFPSGPELLRQAASMPESRVYDEFEANGLAQHQHAAAFTRALRATHSLSLDRVLERRADLAEIGKAFIAQYLLEKESHSIESIPKMDRSQDWLSLLFNELTRGAEDLEAFALNRVTLVTFNYDRLLQHRLLGALAQHYAQPEPECADVFNRIPIIHLHGSLGALPAFSGTSVPYGGVLPTYSTEIDRGSARRSMLIHARNSIQIIHEVQPETSEFKSAYTALEWADRVVFLGFGFNPINIQRLRPECWKPTAQVIGTTHGLTTSEKNYLAHQPLQQHNLQFNARDRDLGDSEDDCMMFLRKHLELFY